VKKKKKIKKQKVFPPCDASDAPFHGQVGNCTSNLTNGLTCIPECDDGYELSGPTMCKDGKLIPSLCQDSCKDIENWVDSKGYSCSTYTDCSNVNAWAVNGMSALNACCLCGGGVRKLSNRTELGCKDLHGWVDSQNYTCSDYGGCQNVEKWGVDRVSAREACCLCGGGTKQ